MTRVLVFTRTKHGADRLCQKLARVQISATAIHGNKSQNARQRALAEFRSGAVRVLVASDIAARGLDIDDVTHVVNFDLPAEPEAYVHRIGRTGRAGAAGDALSLCSPEERDNLRAIEDTVRMSIPLGSVPALHLHTKVGPTVGPAPAAVTAAVPTRRRPGALNRRSGRWRKARSSV